MTKSVIPASITIGVGLDTRIMAELAHMPTAAEIAMMLGNAAAKLEEQAHTIEERAALIHFKGEVRRMRALIETANDMGTNVPKVTPEPAP